MSHAEGEGPARKAKIEVIEWGGGSPKLEV